MEVVMRTMSCGWILAIAVGVVGACAGSGGSGGGDEALLSYDFTAGDKFKYDVELSFQIDVGHSVVKRFLDCDVTEQCMQVQESSYVMKMTFENVNVTMGWRGDPFGAFRNVAGHSVLYTLHANGSVSGIRTEGTIPGWSRIDADIKNMIYRWYARFPVKECGKGEKWKDNWDDNEGTIACAYKTNYEYKGFKKVVARDLTETMYAKVVNTREAECTAPKKVHPDWEKLEGLREFLFDIEPLRLVSLKVSYEYRDMWWEYEDRDIVGDGSYQLKAKRVN